MINCLSFCFKHTVKPHVIAAIETVQKGLYTLAMSLFEAQIGKL